MFELTINIDRKCQSFVQRTAFVYSTVRAGPNLPCSTAHPGGSLKAPRPCESDSDCLHTEACFMAECQDPCQFAMACAPTAKCRVKAHRPICTCPPGHHGNPALNCFPTQPCKTNTLTGPAEGEQLKTKIIIQPFFYSYIILVSCVINYLLFKDSFGYHFENGIFYVGHFSY